ncbi:MAG TPA: DUF4194 domain-containing protein [Candidatus Mediterraneibacter intestinavium]|nr:DUF4194 domain-containing protein [Candidatus Mediterraneibacter intestinavium]
MFKYLEELAVTEAEQVQRVIQALFRQTCILQVKYDPATLTPRDNPQYELCARHRNFIADYVEVLGCELVHDAQEHVFRLVGEHVPQEKLSLTSTVILLLVKLIYRDRIMGEGLNAPLTTLKEIREYGRNTNLITEKLTQAQWREALYLMRTHQVIDVPGAVRDVEDDTPIYIYSTVNLYVTAADINALIEEYRGEEEEYETAEKAFYADPDQ